MNENTITLAGGESASAPKNAPGMEPSLAAAQAPAVTGNAHRPTSSSDRPEQPAAAAVRCMRRIEPHYTENCPNEATGALRVTLKPAPTVSKRWGMQSMLTFVMDLTVCSSCFSKVSIFEVTDPKLRDSLGKTAQRMNNGVLVDWSQTAIDHIPFTDPQYKALRQGMTAKAEAANDSQPGPAGPQREGAGDGTDGPGGRAA